MEALDIIRKHGGAPFYTSEAAFWLHGIVDKQTVNRAYKILARFATKKYIKKYRERSERGWTYRLSNRSD